jgi:hypothetical protein
MTDLSEFPAVDTHVPQLHGNVRPDGTRAELEPRKWKYLSEMTFDELNVALKHNPKKQIVRV